MVHGVRKSRRRSAAILLSTQIGQRSPTGPGEGISTNLDDRRTLLRLFPLRTSSPAPYVEIHPETAAALDIKDGDEVTIENPWGSANEIARVSPTVRRDVISAAHGWWYPEEDGEEPHLFGVWKSNVNSLVPHRVLGKMGFGAPYKQLPAKIYKTPVESQILRGKNQ